VVVSAAVRELVTAGRIEEAHSLIKVFHRDHRKVATGMQVPRPYSKRDELDGFLKAAPPEVYLAVSLPPREAEARLVQTLRSAWSRSTLIAVGEVTGRLSSGTSRRHIVVEMLRRARQLGRFDVLIVLEAVAPIADCLMNVGEWTLVVEQIVNTECWWK
jgi:hypothetical protein